jgi:hypothetical protein
MKCSEHVAPACSGSNLNFEPTSPRRAGALRGRVPVLHQVKLQSGSLLFRLGELAPNLKGRASGAPRDFAQHTSELATAVRAGQNRVVSFLFVVGANCNASGWSHGLVSPKLRANPSLEATRYGRRRLAAQGHRGNCPSAASRRLPQRSPQLER